ncbi:MAG: hypothetical protein ACI89U_000115 [Gammaproteobacteria bacterium]|jgi:hypothetical protein
MQVMMVTLRHEIAALRSQRRVSVGLQMFARYRRDAKLKARSIPSTVVVDKSGQLPDN